MKYLMRLVMGLIFIGFYSINVLNAMEPRKITAADQRTANTAAARLENILFRFRTGNMPLSAYQDAQRMIKTLETYGKTVEAGEWRGLIDSLTSDEVKARAMSMEKPRPRVEEEIPGIEEEEMPGEEEKGETEAEKLAREAAERATKVAAEEAAKAAAEKLAKAEEEAKTAAEKLAKAKEAEEAEKRIAALNLMIWNRSKEFTIVCTITDKDGNTITQDVGPTSTFKLSGIPTQLTVRAKGVVKGWLSLTDGPEVSLDIDNLKNEINTNLTKFLGSDLYIRIIFKKDPATDKEKWEKEAIDLGFVWSCLRLWNGATMIKEGKSVDVNVKYEIFDSSNTSLENGSLGSGDVLRLTSNSAKAKLENAIDSSITKEVNLTTFQKKVQDEKDANVGTLPYLSILDENLDTEFTWEAPQG